uniref:Wsv446-like protein n=1 Tax=Metopaulias depressus WSSV-like virus TaxID=1675544 RepID=A0A0K0VL71_9VIRU|nr:wsv446-like protein [Metopaulias depressus WSSV-like virus]
MGYICRFISHQQELKKMNALILLAISVCFSRPTVGFPSTLWNDSTQNPQEATGGSELRPTAHFDWPGSTPLGINLVFCSCKKFHPTQSFSRNNYSEPENLLWPGSRNVLILSTPQRGGHSIKWASLWKNETENCGCGVAEISSYVEKGSVHPGTVSVKWHDAYLSSISITLNTTGLKNIIKDGDIEYAKSGRSSINIQPVLLFTLQSSSSSRMSSPAVGKVAHYTLIEDAQNAGNSSSCTITYDDFDLKNNESEAVWGVAPSIKNLPICKISKRRLDSPRWKTTLSTTTTATTTEEEDDFSTRESIGGDYFTVSITRSSSASSFDFSSGVNILSCPAVWVCSPELPVVLADEIEENWDKQRHVVVTLSSIGIGFSMLMLVAAPIVLLLSKMKQK